MSLNSVANLYVVYAPTTQWSLGTGVRHVGTLCGQCQYRA